MAISGSVVCEVLVSLDLDGLVRVSTHGHQVRHTLYIHTYVRTYISGKPLPLTSLPHAYPIATNLCRMDQSLSENEQHCSEGRKPDLELSMEERLQHRLEKGLGYVTAYAGEKEKNSCYSS